MLGDDDLVEQGRRDHVHVGESREVGQVVLVGGEVVDGVDPTQQVRDQIAVADVALVEVDLGTQVRGPPVPVYRRGQRVEHDDVVSERQEPVAGVRSDESGASGDEDLHFCRCAPALGDLAIHVEGRRGRRRPRELAGPPESLSRSRSRLGPTASTMARAMDAGSLGSDRTAAPPAVSGMALISEVTTGQPQAMASRMGSPNVSLSDGYTNTSAAW